MSKKEILNIQGSAVVFYKQGLEDYISITDIAKVRDVDNPAQLISLWLRTYSTIEYLGLWEKLNNNDFKPHIYEGFKNRIFCCFDEGNLVVLFNGFQKKTQKTPKNEIERAIRIKDAYFQTKNDKNNGLYKY